LGLQCIAGFEQSREGLCFVDKCNERRRLDQRQGVRMGDADLIGIEARHFADDEVRVLRRKPPFGNLREPVFGELDAFNCIEDGAIHLCTRRNRGKSEESRRYEREVAHFVQSWC